MNSCDNILYINEFYLFETMDKRKIYIMDFFELSKCIWKNTYNNNYY